MGLVLVSSSAFATHFGIVLVAGSHTQLFRQTHLATRNCVEENLKKANRALRNDWVGH
jgi:hypothetical protein